MKKRAFNFPHCAGVAVLSACITGCEQDASSSRATLAAPPAVAVMELPEADTAASKIYIKKCGECHAPPLPTSHTVAEWPSILHRMQYRRIAKGKGALTEPEFKLISEYLSAHARR